MLNCTRVTNEDKCYNLQRRNIIIICTRWMNLYIPNTVMELDTTIDNNQTKAILRTIVLVVVLCLVFNGFRMPKYRPKLMKHMCIIEEEHANTSHVTYTLHHMTPKGQ